MKRKPLRFGNRLITAGNFLSVKELISAEILEWIAHRRSLEVLPPEHTFSFECDFSDITHDFESKIRISVGDHRWLGAAYGNSEYGSLMESLKRLEPVTSFD